MDVVARAKQLILEPQAAWRAIALEQSSPAALLTGYVAVIAIVPALCGLIGALLLGSPIVPSALFALASYLLTFVAVCVEALAIQLLAPLFSGRRDFATAFRVAAYFPTAYWLAAIFFAVPILSVLVLLGLYSFYLLWIGLPMLLRVPAEKAAAATASAGIAAVVIAAICVTVAARVSGVALWVW